MELNLPDELMADRIADTLAERLLSSQLVDRVADALTRRRDREGKAEA